MNIDFEKNKLADAFAEAVMKIAEDMGTDIKTANKLFAAAQTYADGKLRLVKTLREELDGKIAGF